MLTDYPIHASLATADARKARDWYAERLGIEPVLDLPNFLAYRVGPTVFTVFETPAAGTAQHTVAVWGVENIVAEVERLRRRGLTFEDIDLGPQGRTIDGIMTTTLAELGVARNAWFRDGDGNWISLVEQAPHADEPVADVPAVYPSLPASDVSRAKLWYAERLGLEARHVLVDELVYWQDRTHFTVYTTPSAGTAQNTLAVWRVDDLRSEIAALRDRGVVFNDYDLEDLRTTDGVYTDPDDGTLDAWFTDSEGNILGLVEDHGPLMGLV
jgi:catechol 2,3-dioxygenase-like lactoylglutathione lyase family enzyme